MANSEAAAAWTATARSPLQTKIVAMTPRHLHTGFPLCRAKLVVDNSTNLEGYTQLSEYLPDRPVGVKTELTQVPGQFRTGNVPLP
jgi:hypothetical protein